LPELPAAEQLSAMTGKLLVYRSLALLAAGFSAAALAEEFRPEPLLCGLDSGCAAVTGSEYGRPLGVPLPLVGLAAFAAFFVLTLVPLRRRGIVLASAAVLAGFVGLALLLIQLAVLRQVCRLCLVIDVCALALALAALGWRDRSGDVSATRFWPAWATALALACALPALGVLYLAREPAVPDEVRALQKPGRLTVVFVTDFSCDHCRRTHPALREAIAEQPGDVELVMLVYPRPDRPHSRDAARAYHCACEQGKGAEMADALYALDDPDPAACERAGALLGLDLDRYRVCLRSDDVERKLTQARWVESAGVRGLPAIWIGERRLTGLQTKEQLRAALAQAARGR
jgi:protein-disulfide isomerase/uncharacterized membrane protein